MSGFYLMPRGWQDDPVFKAPKDEFSKRDTWIWLVENARWQDGQVLVGGNLMDLKRGQLCFSISYISRAWNWEDSRVRRWLAFLSSVNWIKCNGVQKSTMITVCKYDEIQSPSTSDRRDTDEIPTRYRRDTDDNKKEGKEGNKENKETEIPAEPSASPVQPDLGGLVLTGEVISLPSKQKSKTLVGETWAAYSEAYRQRYKVPPVSNAKINSQLAQFLKRVPAQEAPDIAAFFVWMNDRWLVQHGHPIGSLLANAESYRTQWATGKAMTATRAQQIDQTQSNFNAAEEAMEIIRRNRNGAYQ